jgi:hypothetical protein
METISTTYELWLFVSIIPIYVEYLFVFGAFW